MAFTDLQKYPILAIATILEWIHGLCVKICLMYTKHLPSRTLNGTFFRSYCIHVP